MNTSIPVGVCCGPPGDLVLRVDQEHGADSVELPAGHACLGVGAAATPMTFSAPRARALGRDPVGAKPPSSVSVARRRR